jgi:hypothetical protein
MANVGLSSDKYASTIPSRAGLGVTSITATVTTTGAVATGDTFYMCKMPTGATVLEVIAVTSASWGTTVPVNVGDSGDADRYIAAVDFGGGAVKSLSNKPATYPYTYTADDYILVTLGTVSSGASAGPTMTVTVLYTMNK